MKLTLFAATLSLSAAVTALSLAPRANRIVNQTTCGSTKYAYTGLEGYGFIPADALDKYNDTLGGIGSAAAIDQTSWRQTGRDSFEGIAYCLPDRGWSVDPCKLTELRLWLLHVANTDPGTPTAPSISSRASTR